MSISHCVIFIIILKGAARFMRLKALREDLDIKQKDIAAYLHIKQNTYSQYENGQRQLPVDVLIMLARYYGVSTDYILELTDVKTPYPHK